MHIARLKCADCGATPGWLPPFLLPHKQYPLEVTEPAIEAYITGNSGYATCLSLLATVSITVKTLFNWVEALSQKSPQYVQIACQLLGSLKPQWAVEKDSRLSTSFKPAAHGSKQAAMDSLAQLYVLREYFASMIAPEYFLRWLIFQDRALIRRPTQLDNEPQGLIRDNGPPKTT